jgi:hypothetical protein
MHKGGAYVVDGRWGTDNSVAAGAGEQLYDGRVYPYFTCDRDCRGIDKNHSGSITFLGGHNPWRFKKPKKFSRKRR